MALHESERRRDPPVQGEFQREGLADEINNGIYRNWRPHWMFVGEIVEAEDKR